MSFYVPSNNWSDPVIWDYIIEFWKELTKNIKSKVDFNELSYENMLPSSVNYAVNLDNRTDPAQGCQKNFTGIYNCGLSTSPVKTLTLGAEALGQMAKFDCNSEALKCSSIILRLNDNGRLTLQTSDGKKTLWDSVDNGKKPIYDGPITPAGTFSPPNNVPLTVPEYAGDGKPNPKIDVGPGGGPGRRYSRSYLLPGQFLERGQWIGSPSGTCRLIMGTPENPNSLQVVTTILGCNSLDGAISKTNDHLTDLGCWVDSGSRALSKFNGHVTTKEQCAAMAKANGSDTFGLQYYGECWSNVPGDDYKKYGKSTKTCTDLGTGWQNHVYSIGSLEKEATRAYTIPDINNKDIGKVAYVNYEGQLQLYPDTNMTKYDKNFENIGNYNINGAFLGTALNASSIEACKTSCLNNGDTQKCAGFVFDTTAARCQLLDKTLNTKQRIIDPNYQYYIRQKGVKGQDVSCPTEVVNDTTSFWNGMVYNSTNMTPTSKCGLAKFTENERAKVEATLPTVYDNLQYKDKNGKVLDIKYPTAVTDPNVRKTGFKYWYESLESKYSQLKNNIFNTNASIDATFTELQESKQNLADWSGEQLQNLSAMNEDRDLNMMSQNYRHIMWSILAILIIIATMKMTKSVAKGSV
jgi:hypothetical protein